MRWRPSTPARPCGAACPVARFHHATAQSADFEARTVPVLGRGCADGAAAGRDLQAGLVGPGARSGFVTLPGYLLFGACLAVFDRWLSALARLLFSDAVGDDEEGGTGARVLRALGWGAVAGVVGGALFTWVMVEIGFPGTVARLVGSRSPVTGLVVHFGISVLIGASYGLLFRRQSDDLGSALGWGVAYGFFWWVLGGITLLPI